MLNREKFKVTTLQSEKLIINENPHIYKNILIINEKNFEAEPERSVTHSTFDI